MYRETCWPIGSADLRFCRPHYTMWVVISDMMVYVPTGSTYSNYVDQDQLPLSETAIASVFLHLVLNSLSDYLKDSDLSVDILNVTLKPISAPY